MNIDLLFPSKYVSFDDLNGRRINATIDRVVIESMGNPPERKAVIYFQKGEKGMVLGKTNAMTIKSMHGKETDDWEGKRITLYGLRGVQAFGKVYNVVRVADVAPPAPVQAEEKAVAEALNDPDDVDHDEDFHEEAEEVAGDLAALDLLKEIGRLGAQANGADNWRDVRAAKAAKWASSNRVAAVDDLTTEEAVKLRDYLRGLVAELAAQSQS